MKKNWLIFLPGFIGVAFVVFFSCCTRLSYDDLLFAACFKTKSFFEAFNYLYHTHTFRWTTFLTEDLVLGVVPGLYFPISIAVFFIVFYTAWLLSLGALIRILCNKYVDYCPDKLISVGMACTIITTIYFFASQVVESFTSVIIVTDRLLPLLFLTWVLIILVEDKVKFRSAKLIIWAFLLAGTAENVTITILLFFGVAIVYKWILTRSKPTTGTLTFVCSLIIFFVLENLSPGRSARLQVEQIYHFSCGTDGVYCANTFADFIRKFFISRHILIPVLLVPFISFATSLPIGTREKLKESLPAMLTITLLAAIPVLLFHFVSAQWVFQCYGPMRMWFAVNCVLALIGMLISLHIGTIFRSSVLFHGSFASVAISAMLLLYFTRHVQPTLTYTRAYDNRISMLAHLTSSGGVISVKALPPSDMVVYGDIMSDENDDVNRDFSDTYGFRFKVRKQ